jgi:hypothetical protein
MDKRLWEVWRATGYRPLKELASHGKTSTTFVGRSLTEEGLTSTNHLWKVRMNRRPNISAFRVGLENMGCINTFGGSNSIDVDHLIELWQRFAGPTPRGHATTAERAKREARTMSDVWDSIEEQLASKYGRMPAPGTAASIAVSEMARAVGETDRPATV